MRSPVVAALLLVIAIGVVYAPTLGYPFVYEDNNDASRWGRSVALQNPTRLLTEASFDLSADPETQHAINVWLHMVNSVLVLLLAWLVLPPAGAVFAGAVFALSPVQVEAVAYVSGRADLLSGCGVLLALLAASLGSLTAALLATGLACLSKEAAIVAWGLVPVWAIVTRAPFPVRKFLLIGAGGAGVVALALLSDIPHLRPALDLEHIGRTAWSVVRLAALMVVPMGQSIDHDWHGATLALQSVSVGLLVALTVGALWRVQQQRAGWPALAWLLLVVWTLPRFVVVASEGLHEHHLVVPMIGWALCAGAWLSTTRARESKS